MMKKKQLLSALALSTLALAQSGFVLADDVTPADPSAPATEVVPTEVTADPAPATDVPAPTDTPVEQPIPADKPVEQPAPIDPSTTPDTPSTPTTNEPTTPDPENTAPSQDTPQPSTNPAPAQTETPTTSEPTKDTDSKPQTESPSTKPTAEQPIVDNGDGTKTVVTDNGQKVTLSTDLTKPTNNPNVTAQQAQEAGASQVGTTSKVTGQIVQNVTKDAPLTLYNGATITDIQAGVATLTDGTTAKLTDLGAKENEDGTFTVKDATGEKTTLPETGETSSLGLTLLGVITLFGSLLGLKRKVKGE